MNSIVIYGSRHGNTRKLAETIAGTLRKHGRVEVVSAEKGPAMFLESTDLLVIGGPTEGHRMTEPIAQFFDRLGKGALAGKAAAAFDTRLRWPVWLSGSAGSGIEQKLVRAGARVVVPEMSFFVSGKLPVLEPGELERAAAWAASLVTKVEPKERVGAGM